MLRRGPVRRWRAGRRPPMGLKVGAGQTVVVPSRAGPGWILPQGGHRRVGPWVALCTPWAGGQLVHGAPRRRTGGNPRLAARRGRPLGRRLTRPRMGVRVRTTRGGRSGTGVAAQSLGALRRAGDVPLSRGGVPPRTWRVPVVTAVWGISRHRGVGAGSGAGLVPVVVGVATDRGTPQARRPHPVDARSAGRRQAGRGGGAPVPRPQGGSATWGPPEAGSC